MFDILNFPVSITKTFALLLFTQYLFEADKEKQSRHDWLRCKTERSTAINIKDWVRGSEYRRRFQ